MKTKKEIAAARNVLLRALVEDAKGRNAFRTNEDLFTAVFEMGVFNWLFGDDDPEAECPHHKEPTFGRKLDFLRNTLERDAGCSDPESSSLYLQIKNRMQGGLSMWDVLREITRTAEKERSKAANN